MYVHKAGTIILASTVILYICNTLPQKKVFSQDYDAKIAAAEKITNEEDKKAAVEKIEFAKQAELMEYTISGKVGKALEPFFKPMGFDWKLTTASIGALAAKEVFVAQLGVLYSEGETDEESESLRNHLIRNYTQLQAFCIMLFCLLSIPCLATLAIIKRELTSWKMAIVEAVGLFALAYILTAIVYQAGLILNIGTKFIA